MKTPTFRRHFKCVFRILFFTKQTIRKKFAKSSNSRFCDEFSSQIVAKAITLFIKNNKYKLNKKLKNTKVRLETQFDECSRIPGQRRNRLK